MYERYYYSEFMTYEYYKDHIVTEKEYIDLSLYPNDSTRQKMRVYIEKRYWEVLFLGIIEEGFIIEVLGEFFHECEPYMNDFLDLNEYQIYIDFSDWMSDFRYQKVREDYKKQFHKKSISVLKMKRYLKEVLLFFRQHDEREEWEKDIWELDKLNIRCRNNPIHPRKTLNFTKISQKKLRMEIKQAVAIWIKYLAVNTITIRLAAFNKFSAFLNNYHKEIESAMEINRDHIEGYLIHRRVNIGEEKYLTQEIQSLKIIFEELARILEKPQMGYLFLNDDIPSQPRCRFITYSESEQQKWINAIGIMQEQVGRAFLIHLMLGTRISDVLTLKQDCINQEDGVFWIRIDSVKGNVYRKPITLEIALLLEKAIAYTQNKYSVNNYIFVNNKDPDRPMTYACMRYHIEKMIREAGLQNEEGESYSAKTHIFRHCYAVKLTEDHVEDEMIAALLGHRNTDNVKYYRRMSNKMLAKETRQAREEMDNILIEIVKDWPEYGEYF